jgi:hypothetical protein
MLRTHECCRAIVCRTIARGHGVLDRIWPPGDLTRLPRDGLGCDTLRCSRRPKGG